MFEYGVITVVALLILENPPLLTLTEEYSEEDRLSAGTGTPLARALCSEFCRMSLPARDTLPNPVSI